MRSLLSVVRSCLRLYYRYPANIAMTVSVPCIFILVGSVFSKITNLERFQEFSGGSTNLVTYLLVGLTVWLLSSATSGVAGSVETEISWGTLDSRLSSPTPVTVVITGMSIASIVQALIMCTIIALGLLFFSDLSLQITTLGSLALGLIVFFGVGMILASLALRWRRVGGMITSLSFLEQFLCGAFVPVRALPAPMRGISYMLPSTWVLDSVRSSFLSLQMLVDRRVETWILCGLALVTNIVGFALLRRAERRIRLLGISENY